MRQAYGGRADYLQRAPTQINLVAIVQPVSYLKRPRGSTPCIEARGQCAADSSGASSAEHLPGPARIAASEVRIHPETSVKRQLSPT